MKKTIIIVTEEHFGSGTTERSIEVIGDKPTEGMAKQVINSLLFKIRIRRID